MLNFSGHIVFDSSNVSNDRNCGITLEHVTYRPPILLNDYSCNKTHKHTHADTILSLNCHMLILMARLKLQGSHMDTGTTDAKLSAKANVMTMCRHFSLTTLTHTLL